MTKSSRPVAKLTSPSRSTRSAPSSWELMSKMAGIAVGLALATAGNVQAQTVANSFEELRGLLTPGRSITVTDEAGRTTRGKVAKVSIDALVIDTEGATGHEQRTFGNGPLRALAERDSLWDGLGWGALAGFGAAAVATAACQGCEGSLVFAFAAAGTIPGGAAAGIIADLIHRPELRVEYVKNTSPRAVTMVPWLGVQARGVSVSIRW